MIMATYPPSALKPNEWFDEANLFLQTFVNQNDICRSKKKDFHSGRVADFQIQMTQVDKL